MNLPFADGAGGRDGLLVAPTRLGAALRACGEARGGGTSFG